VACGLRGLRGVCVAMWFLCLQGMVPHRCMGVCMLEPWNGNR
jgi:hypothetical protein